MAHQPLYVLYLDDYHAGDALFLQSLGRALARIQWERGPVIVHGGAESAERLLEANGIFRQREHGLLMVESATEAALVERATRTLNQKIVGIMTDAIVSTVGLMGTQRGVFVLREGELEADGTIIREISDRGVVAVVSAYATDAQAGSTGEVPVPDAVIALMRTLSDTPITTVAFTKTNLPGVMRSGVPVETMSIDDPSIQGVLPDLSGVRKVAATGARVLITNTTRFADANGPVGTWISAAMQ